MKRRFHNLSIYRIIATILIIQFHVFFLTNVNALNNEYLLSKFMQGLTALSGFLYSQKIISDYKGFYLTNFKKIAIPAIISVLFMATWNLAAMFANSNFIYLSLFSGIRPYNGAFLLQFGNFYYIGYILLCYLITPLLQRGDKYSNIIIALSIIIEIILAFFMGSSSIILSYILGYYIGRKSFEHYVDETKEFEVKRFLFWLGLLIATLGLFFVTRIYNFNEDYILKNLMNTINIFVSTIFGVATLFLFAYIFRFINKYRGNIKLLSYTDKLSYILYLFNQCFMVGAMDVTIYFDNLFIDYVFIYGFTFIASILTLTVYDLLFNKKKTKFIKGA